MEDPTNLLNKLCKHLPNISEQSQAEITRLSDSLFFSEEIEDLVEAQNLAIKIQRSFEEIIFRRALTTYEDPV